MDRSPARPHASSVLLTMLPVIMLRGRREANKVADALSNVAMDGDGWEGLRDPQAQPNKQSLCCMLHLTCIRCSKWTPACLTGGLLHGAGSHLAGREAGRRVDRH